jgi:hypothetical protein
MSFKSLIRHEFNKETTRRRTENCDLEKVERDVDSQHFFKKIEPCRATTKQQPTQKKYIDLFLAADSDNVIFISLENMHQITCVHF